MNVVVACGNLSRPTSLIREELNSAGPENGRHGVVDPDIQAAPGGDHLRGCSLHGLCVGYVNGNDKRLAARLLDLTGRTLEALTAASDQSDPPALSPKRNGHRAADPGGCSGDDDNRTFPVGFVCCLIDPTHLTITL